MLHKNPSTSSDNGAHSRPLSIAVVLICAIFLCAYYGPGILNEDIFTNDMAQFTSWAYHFRDRSIFTHDPNRVYFVSNFPLGYLILLKFIAPIVDPQLFGEILGLALGSLVAFLSYYLGSLLCHGRAVGGFSALLLVTLGQVTKGNFNFMLPQAGGIPRSFCIPILLLGVIFAHRRNWPAMAGCFLVGALFYPPVLIMLGTYSLIVLTSDLLRTRRAPRGFFRFAGLTMVCIALIAVYRNQATRVTGPVFTLTEMKTMPEFHLGGILPFFPEHWSSYILQALGITRFNSPILGFLWFALVVTTFSVGVLRKNPRVLNAAFWALPVSALINFTVANTVLLQLYEPVRYLDFPFRILGLCCWVLGSEFILRLMEPKIVSPHTSKISRKLITGGMLGLLAIAGIGLLTVRIRLRLGGMSDNMPSAVYERLRTLPTDALIASLPMDGYRIPMRSKRGVLLMWPSMYPYHPQFYNAVIKRLEYTLKALYDPTPKSLISMRDKYRARYFLVNQKLGDNEPLLKFQPLDKILTRSKYMFGGRQPFILSPPEDSIIFREGEYTLIDLSRIKFAKDRQAGQL